LGSSSNLDSGYCWVSDGSLLIFFSSLREVAFTWEGGNVGVDGKRFGRAGVRRNKLKMRLGFAYKRALQMLANQNCIAPAQYCSLSVSYALATSDCALPQQPSQNSTSFQSLSSHMSLRRFSICIRSSILQNVKNTD